MKKVILLLLIMFGLANVTWAGVWWNPTDPGATYQKWTFDDADNPAAPEIDQNPFDGDPLATIVAQGNVHGGDPGWRDEFLGRLGVWHGDTVDITMVIPNRPDPLPYKEIWVYFEYRGDLVASDVIPTGGETVTPLGQDSTTLPDGWKEGYIGWKVEPNPFGEDISLSFVDSGADLNWIEVYTICIPEPASMTLLGIAGLALVRKTRKET